jgi:hypothetical protein
MLNYNTMDHYQRIVMVVYHLFFGHEANQVEIVFVMLDIILAFLVGQLWIEEDEQQESFSQKIQLTNSSLRVEHSLKSDIKNVKKKRI